MASDSGSPQSVKRNSPLGSEEIIKIRRKKKRRKACPSIHRRKEWWFNAGKDKRHFNINRPRHFSSLPTSLVWKKNNNNPVSDEASSCASVRIWHEDRNENTTYMYTYSRWLCWFVKQRTNEKDRQTDWQPRFCRFQPRDRPPLPFATHTYIHLLSCMYAYFGNSDQNIETQKKKNSCSVGWTSLSSPFFFFSKS